MANLELRANRTALRSACGQPSGGPSGEAAQRRDPMSAPISLPSARGLDGGRRISACPWTDILGPIRWLSEAVLTMSPKAHEACVMSCDRPAVEGGLHRPCRQGVARLEGSHDMRALAG